MNSQIDTEGNRSNSERLLGAAGESWTAALGMRFIREAVDGVLLPAVFDRYRRLEQDFVRAAVVCLCRAVATSPSRWAYDGHLRTLHHLIEDQLPGLSQVAAPSAEPSADRPELTSSALSEFVTRLSLDASYVEIVCCMLPSEVLYARWCAAAQESGRADGALGAWIDLHTCAPYTDQVAFLVSEVDRLHLSDGEIERLGKLIGHILDLEVAMHDNSYDVPRGA